MDETQPNAVELATELTIAWLSNQNNRVTAEKVSAFLKTMHSTPKLPFGWLGRI